MHALKLAHGCCCVTIRSGVDGLTNQGLIHMTHLSKLTQLIVEAECQPGITVACFNTISELTSLRHLQWSSQDSQQSMDIEALLPQLCALTSLHRLCLCTNDPRVHARATWHMLLQHKLPLCTVTFSGDLQCEDAWHDSDRSRDV